jgi:hypothetical protein
MVTLALEALSHHYTSQHGSIRIYTLKDLKVDKILKCGIIFFGYTPSDLVACGWWNLDRHQAHSARATSLGGLPEPQSQRLSGLLLS